MVYFLKLANHLIGLSFSLPRTLSQKYSDSTSSSNLTVKGTALQTRTLFLSDWSLLSYRLISLFKIEFSAVLFDRPIINMTQHILYYLYERVFAFFSFTAEYCRYNRWLQFCSRKPQILKFQHAKRPTDSTLWHCWTHTHTHTRMYSIPPLVSLGSLSKTSKFGFLAQLFGGNEGGQFFKEHISFEHLIWISHCVCVMSCTPSLEGISI